MKYKIGTRGSGLALAQTETVRRALQAGFPEHVFETVIVKTTGDRVQDRSLRQVGTTGIFTRELEQQLFSGQIDIAVHSMKDMPAQLPQGLAMCHVMPRQDARDVLLTPDGRSLMELPQGAVIGTGSLRRKFQLLALRPDLQIVDIRGNIDTRLRKMAEQNLDGIVLAAAGLLRLEVGLDRISHWFTPEEMLPAPTQGVLGAQYAEAREDVRAMLASLSDPEQARPVAAERSFLAKMQVGCHMPVAAYCDDWQGKLRLRAMYGQEDGSELRFLEAVGDDPEEIAQNLTDQFRKTV